jgi:hypothetical protein
VIPMCYTCDTSVIPVSCPNDTCVILLRVSYVKDRITALKKALSKLQVVAASSLSRPGALCYVSSPVAWTSSSCAFLLALS